MLFWMTGPMESKRPSFIYIFCTYHVFIVALLHKRRGIKPISSLLQYPSSWNMANQYRKTHHLSVSLQQVNFNHLVDTFLEYIRIFQTSSMSVSYCKFWIYKFCIYTLPVNSKFTIWHLNERQLSRHRFNCYIWHFY